MEKMKYVMVQNDEQMKQMIEVLNFQGFKLNENVLPDLAQDQVLALNYEDRSVECLPAAKVLENSDKLVKSVNRYMNEATCYRITEGNIAICGDYDLSNDEELYPLQNPYNTDVVMRLGKDDYIELRPDGSCQGYPFHDEMGYQAATDIRYYFNLRVADKEEVKDMLENGYLITVDENELKQAVEAKIKEEEKEWEKIQPVMIDLEGSDIHQIEAEFNQKIESYLNDADKEGNLMVYIRLNNEMVVNGFDTHKEEILAIKDRGERVGIPLFQELLKEQGYDPIKKEIKDPNNPSLYQIKGSDPISIYGIFHDVYDVVDEEDTFVFKNGEEAEIARLKQGDFIKAYPDGKVKDFYNLSIDRLEYGPEPKFVFSDFSISANDSIEKLVSQGQLREATHEELEQGLKKLWEQAQQDSDYFDITYNVIIRNGDLIEASQQVEDAIQFYVKNNLQNNVDFDYKANDVSFDCKMTSQEIKTLYSQSVAEGKPLFHALLEKNGISVENDKIPFLPAHKETKHKSLDDRLRSAQEKVNQSSQREIPLKEKDSQSLKR